MQFNPRIERVLTISQHFRLASDLLSKQIITSVAIKFIKMSPSPILIASTQQILNQNECMM